MPSSVKVGAIGTSVTTTSGRAPDSSPEGGQVLHDSDDLDSMVEEPPDALADEDFVFGDDDTEQRRAHGVLAVTDGSGRHRIDPSRNRGTPMRQGDVVVVLPESW